MLSINLSFEPLYSLKRHPKFCRPIFESWVRDMKKSLRSFFISSQSYTCTTLNVYITWNSHFQWTLTPKVYKLSLLSYFQHLYQEKKKLFQKNLENYSAVMTPHSNIEFPDYTRLELDLKWEKKCFYFQCIVLQPRKCLSLISTKRWL